MGSIIVVTPAVFLCFFRFIEPSSAIAVGAHFINSWISTLVLATCCTRRVRTVFGASALSVFLLLRAWCRWSKEISFFLLIFRTFSNEYICALSHFFYIIFNILFSNNIISFLKM
jgi:hypothetical protein